MIESSLKKNILRKGTASGTSSLKNPSLNSLGMIGLNTCNANNQFNQMSIDRAQGIHFFMTRSIEQTRFSQQKVKRLFKFKALDFIDRKNFWFSQIIVPIRFLNQYEYNNFEEEKKIEQEDDEIDQAITLFNSSRKKARITDRTFTQIEEDDEEPQIHLIKAQKKSEQLKSLRRGKLLKTQRIFDRQSNARLFKLYHSPRNSSLIRNKKSQFSPRRLEESYQTESGDFSKYSSFKNLKQVSTSQYNQNESDIQQQQNSLRLKTQRQRSFRLGGTKHNIYMSEEKDDDTLVINRKKYEANMKTLELSKIYKTGRSMDFDKVSMRRVSILRKGGSNPNFISTGTQQYSKRSKKSQSSRKKGASVPHMKWVSNKQIVEPYFNAFFQTAQKNQTMKLQSLLHKYVGFDIDNRDAQGLTMLHKAAYNGHLKMIKFLIFKGANINAKDIKGNTPLHYANAYDHKQVLNTLIEAGANQRQKNKSGKAPWEGI